MKAYRDLSKINFKLKFKQLPTHRLLTYYRKIAKTTRIWYSYGWCCEGKCFHYNDEHYYRPELWPSGQYAKLNEYRLKIKDELDKRENIN